MSDKFNWDKDGQIFLTFQDNKIGFINNSSYGAIDFGSNYFILLPSGTNDQRIDISGCFRFNNTLGILEGYRGGDCSGWHPLYNQGSDDMKTRISFDDGLDLSYNIHFYTNNNKCMTLTEDGSLCIGLETGDKKINIDGTTNCDNLYYNGTLFKTIPDYIYNDLSINDTSSYRYSGYNDTHTVDVSQNLDVSGLATINKIYVYNESYNYNNQPYSVKLRGDFRTSRLELSDMNYDNSLNIGNSSDNLPYSRNGDVRVNSTSKHFQVYYNSSWQTSKSLQRPFMAFDSSGTSIFADSNALDGLTRIDLSGGKYITNDTTTFSCTGGGATTSKFTINYSGVYLLTLGVVFSSSNNIFRYIFFKSENSDSDTSITSTNFYSPGTRDYLFNDSSNVLWADTDSTNVNTDGYSYYEQVQDFGAIEGEGLSEKTIPFVLESGKSITMFAAYQGTFEKLYMRFLKLGPLDSITSGTTDIYRGYNTYTITGTTYEEKTYISTTDSIEYISIRFLDDGVITFDQDTEVDVLLVAGGGGGGVYFNSVADSGTLGDGGTGGGGGAGGVLVAEGVEFTAGVSNNITVGDGGAGDYYLNNNTTRLANCTGEDTLIEEDGGNGYSMTVNGGGAGASGTDADKRIGGSGGSGGGSGWYYFTWDGGGSSAAANYSGGAAVDGTITYSYTDSATFYGNSGGNGKERSTHDTGGGGGAGGRPTLHCHPRTYDMGGDEGWCGSYYRDSQTGGDGILNNFWDGGNGTYYGGGGAGDGTKAIGDGGLGGGGGESSLAGTDGLGGGGSATQATTASDGGSGVVILRFKPIG